MFYLFVAPNLENVTIKVYATVAEMRPPAAIFFGFLQVDFHNACPQEIGIALVNQVTIRGSHDAFPHNKKNWYGERGEMIRRFYIDLIRTISEFQPVQTSSNQSQWGR